MPSAQPLVSIPEFLDAFGRGVRAKNKYGNTRRGARYDHWAGEGAILFSREVQRDRDLFRAKYFDTSDGTDLTTLVSKRFGIDRIVDAFGEGTMNVARASAAAGAGRFYAGSRILVFPAEGLLQSARYYAVLEDTDVPAGALTCSIPIRAVTPGTGQALNLNGGGAGALIATIDDPIWDTTWVVSALRCDDGEDFEKAEDFRARVRQLQLDARRGYAKFMTDTCVAAGATFVALFASNYAGDATDHGLNVCYVADSNYQTTDKLRRDCTIALEGARNCGADLQVLGMSRSALSVRATVTLWDSPGAFNLNELSDLLGSAIVADLDGVENGFSYTRDAWTGAMQQATDAVQAVAFTTPSVDAPLVSGSPPNFPAVLTRWTLNQSDCVFTFQGPS